MDTRRGREGERERENCFRKMKIILNKKNAKTANFFVESGEAGALGRGDEKI